MTQKLFFKKWSEKPMFPRNVDIYKSFGKLRFLWSDLNFPRNVERHDQKTIFVLSLKMLISTGKWSKNDFYVMSKERLIPWNFGIKGDKNQKLISENNVLFLEKLILTKICPKNSFSKVILI